MPVLVTTYSLSRNDGDVLLRLALTRTDSFPQTDADTSARCCPPYNKMPQTLRPQPDCNTLRFQLNTTLDAPPVAYSLIFRRRQMGVRYGLYICTATRPSSTAWADQ
jgi:hypothetical protein